MGVLTKLRDFVWGKPNNAIATTQAPTEDVEKRHFVVFGSDGTWLTSATLSDSGLTSMLEAAAKSYACITANSEAAASLPWVVQRRAGAGWVADPTHELNELLRNPTGVPADARPMLSWQQWLELMFQHLYLEGDAFDEIGRVGKRPVALNPLFPDKVKVDTQDGRTATLYRYNGTHKIVPENMLHVWNTNPGSLLEGQAPYDAAEDAISTESTAQQRTDAELTNKIQPGIMVIFEKGIKREQADDFLSDLNDRFGENSDSGKPLVLGGGPEVKSFPATIVDFEKVRKLAAADIYAVFGTPPPIVGDMQAATLQNFATAVRIWWNNKLFPLLQLAAGSINTQVVHPFYGPDVRLWYDVAGTEVGLVLFDAAVDIAQKLVNVGYPPNIAAEKVGLGMPHVPELDKPLQQLALAGREDEGDESEDDETT
jgi:HK97 family phage portal protein